ncbi:P-loop containing nucleoside triphosphate hydrolase protein [Mycena filopes]|nr:P-loop containing nucleoside triphosphate hydrolase protein [Mycena filopes]
MHPPCTTDASFGPVSSCRSVDLTLYFEQTILCFAPDLTFVLLALVRLWYLQNRPKQPTTTRGTALLASKGCAVLLVLASAISALVYSRNYPSVFVWLPASIMHSVSAFALSALALLEHRFSPSPSTLVLSYAFIRGLCAATVLRSAVKIGVRSPDVGICAITVSAYFLVFGVELIPKPYKKGSSVLSRSSFLAKSLYLWLIPLLWTGRKKKLRIEDCGPIPEEFGAVATRELLLNVTRTGGSNHLLRNSLLAFPLTFLAPVFPRILLILATFSKPLLVSNMISYIAESNPDPQLGWALVGAYACVYGLIALATSIYWEKVFDGTVQYRGGLVGSIYAKSLRLSSASARELGGGVASTYMSVDVERICQGLEILHETWAAVVSIALAILLLYSQATWPAFFPLAITFLFFGVAAYVSRGVGASQGRWLGATDKRVKYLTSVLHNYLPMKWARYEPAVSKRAAQLRAREMQGAHSFYNNICITGALSATAGIACSLSVLGPYAALSAHGHGSLDPQRMFTIFATMSLMTGPLDLIGSYLPSLMAAWASLKRIERYLSLEEKRIPTPDHGEKGRVSSEKHIDLDIRLEGASFAWAHGKPSTLGPLTLALRHNQLHICLGPIASGKTTFLLSLLRETTLTQGSISVPTTQIAYAAQEALIISGTVRENIIFGHEYSAEWYARVLHACALSSEVNRMDAGDGTLLSERGGNLSGAMRNFRALARAVYTQAPWTLLDDTFSALDAHTARHVFQSLFGSDGLLRGRGVILISHSAQHLGADNILVLESGSIQHQGTLGEIRDSGYQIQDVVSQEEDELAPDQVDIESGKSKEKKPEGEGSISARSLGFTPYFFYGRLSGWMNSVVVVALLSLTALIRLAARAYAQQWSQHSQQHVGNWVAGYAGLTLGTFVSITFGMWAFAQVITRRVGQGIHAEELSRLLHTSPGYVMRNSAGRLINRFSQDIFMCDLEFPVTVLNIILGIVTIAGSLAFILMPAPWLALAVPFAGAIYWVVLSFYLKTSKQFQQLAAESKSPLYTLFSTTLSGLVTIRAMGVENHFQALNDAHLDRSQIPFFFRLAGLRFLRTFLSLIAFTLAVGLAALVVGLRNSINPATLGVALSSLTSISVQLSEFVMSLSSLENAGVSISRIHEIATLPKEEDALATTDDFTDILVSAPSITLKEVHLRYMPELPDAISDVSFHISRGQKIGICGRSGSGKSTLIMALFRGLEPSLMSGQVLINGRDIQSAPLEILRNSMSLVSQHPVIWYASVRENLDPQATQNDEALWAVLKRVGVHDAISALPAKLDTMLEDQGQVLSAGQRQLLCLARVLLRNRRLVILDEASSSLDLETDRKIGEVIRSELVDCTVLSIAHRVATVIDFDLILVMEEGKPVEIGTPTELLSRPTSKFAALAAQQQVGGAAAPEP